MDATSDAFGSLNVVQAWFDEDDCPCVVTDNDTDKIDYPDFKSAWDYTPYAKRMLHYPRPLMCRY